ncbi:MAG: ABC transporter substrate-binding protein [Nitrospiraceae bacterium]
MSRRSLIAAVLNTIARPRLVSVLLSAIAAVAFIAWLSAVDLGADTPQPNSHVTLRFVSWKPDHPRAWDEAIARFQETHPDISVIREIAPHSSTAYHDLLTQKLKNRDRSVDLFFMDVIWVPEFAAAGWVLPLDALFPESEQASFLPTTIVTGRYQDHLYGVPSRIDAGMLYYRADLLSKYGYTAPRTWMELVEQAETIVKGEASSQPTLRGYSAQFKQYEGLVCNMLELVGSHGGSLIAERDETSTLAAPETLAALRFARDQLMGRVAPRALLTYQEPESLAAFVQGQTVFHRNWPYAWEVANDRERSKIVGLVDVAALPGTTDHRGVATLGGWLFGISALSVNQREAWTFISFLSSEASQKHFALAAGIAPSRRALYDDPALLEAHPHWRNQLTVLESATPRPRTPVYPAVSHILQRFFSRALAYPAIDLAGEAAKADEQITRLLELTRSTR